jgi:hypothetical protein
LRRSTNAALMKEITVSPFWFSPLLRIEIKPHFGRLLEGRLSITSVK